MTMKVPLEPIPKESLEPDNQEESEASGPGSGGLSTACRKLGLGSGQLETAYPWLLAVSIMISAILCWLYVTKPVIVQSETSSGSQSAETPMDPVAVVHRQDGDGSAAEKGALVPSDSVLPGSKESVSSPPASSAENNGSPETIAPAILAKSRVDSSGGGLSLGWEATNLKVQHILSADTGSEGLEKIVLNVPVLYQTRTMRWEAEDIAKARNVMKRLVVYERNLNKLRGEGHAILKDWGDLLNKTSPTVALRADSPTLPYNHGQGSESTELHDSSTVIKIEH